MGITAVLAGQEDVSVQCSWCSPQLLLGLEIGQPCLRYKVKEGDLALETECSQNCYCL